MEEVSIIGVDLAKNVFQLHGAAADGSVVFRKKLRTAVRAVHGGPSGMRGGDGGVSQRALLGIGTDRARAPGPADWATLRQAILEAPKE